jgi:hypothetical protein
MKIKLVLLSLLCIVFGSSAYADSTPVTIDFESLSDSTVINSSYASLGVTFTNAVVATAGISLNEIDFPPHSGSNVSVDALGPITLTFSTPVSAFLGYFTYTEQLSLTGYNAGDQVVASVASLFSANYTSSGNPPNELIQLDYSGGITQITIAGDIAGGSFAMDDITYTPVNSNPVPEPETFLLLGCSLICLFIFRKLFSYSTTDHFSGFITFPRRRSY